MRVCVNRYKLHLVHLGTDRVCVSPLGTDRVCVSPLGTGRVCVSHLGTDRVCVSHLGTDRVYHHCSSENFVQTLKHMNCGRILLERHTDTERDVFE